MNEQEEQKIKELIDQAEPYLEINTRIFRGEKVTPEEYEKGKKAFIAIDQFEKAYAQVCKMYGEDFARIAVIMYMRVFNFALQSGLSRLHQLIHEGK